MEHTRSLKKRRQLANTTLTTPATEHKDATHNDPIDSQFHNMGTTVQPPKPTGAISKLHLDTKAAHHHMDTNAAQPTKRTTNIRHNQATATIMNSWANDCLFCGRAGHTVADCQHLHTIGSYRGGAKSLIKCTFCARTGHTTAACHTMRCHSDGFKAMMYGHRTNYKIGTQCTFCDHAGHTYNECYSFKFFSRTTIDAIHNSVTNHRNSQMGN
jgi:hypothetical protein